MRVLIADDHKLMVEGTKQALLKAGGFEVVGEASNGVQVMPLVRRLKPDLVLLDLRMPQMDGLTCLTKIRKEFPDLKVAVPLGLTGARADSDGAETRCERVHRQDSRPR